MIDADSGKPATTDVSAHLKGSWGSSFDPSWQTSSHEDGTFELRNLLPGEYVLMASTSNRGERDYGREEVSIADSDITGVKLTLEQGVTVTGTVKLEGDGPPGRLSVFLSDMGGAYGNAHSAGAKGDGTFEFHGIASGKYDVRMEVLPDGAYIKSVRFGGQDVTHTMLDFITLRSPQN